MSDLLDRIIDTFPANGDTGVPLLSSISFTLSGVDYDEDSLTEGFFVEGPDTDQFVGPGMVSLKFPDNVSQNDLDDFFESPGRAGIVKGTTEVSEVSGNTLVSFTSTLPLAASIVYKANLTGVLASDGVTEIDGFVTISFTSGSGSIEEIPAETSTSVLSQSYSGSGSLTALSVVKTTPLDHSVENDADLEEIVIEFNKDLDPDTISADQITVETYPAVDHPNLSIEYAGTVTKVVEVDGKLLRIKI